MTSEQATVRAADDPSLKEVDGRKFHPQGTTYHFPADNIEFTRLDRQHRKNTIALGGLYTCPELVNLVLAPGDTKRQILDLGCGSGIWSVEMALEFPQAAVLGLDLAPNVIKAIPPNCEFRIHDINHGLSEYYNTFDIVHMRSVIGGLKSFRPSVYEAAKCVKPGGVFLLVEGDFEMYAEDTMHLLEPIDGQFPDGSWVARFFYELQTAVIKRGQDVLIGLTSCDIGLWGFPGYDQDTVGSMSLFTPLTPWPQSPYPQEQEKLQMMGNLQREVFKDVVSGCRSALIASGVAAEFIDSIQEQCVQQVDELTHKIWSRFRYNWARKLLEDGSAASAVPVEKKGYAPMPPASHGQPVQCEDPEGGKYHMKHFYYSKEASLAWTGWKQKERRRIGVQESPDVPCWGDDA